MSDADLTVAEAAGEPGAPGPRRPSIRRPRWRSIANTGYPRRRNQWLDGASLPRLPPVVIDVETGGFHSATDALLEIAAVLIDIEPTTLKRGATHSFHVKPFEGSRLDPLHSPLPVSIRFIR